LAGEFVEATLQILSGREREPPHKKLLQDLSGLSGLPMQHTLPLREPGPNLAIKAPDVECRHQWSLTEVMSSARN